MASQSLWLDCELRVLTAVGRQYRVELTLNDEQHFNALSDTDLAAWIGTGDRQADGQSLFKALLGSTAMQQGWGVTRGRSTQRRIRLRLDAPELQALPWELLRDGNDLLAADANTPFSRYVPIEKEWGHALTGRPIRVLAVIANPVDLSEKYGLPAADVALEQQTLREACGLIASSPERELGNEVRLTFLTPPITLDRLEAELRQGCEVLHFIGHGAFSVTQQQAAIYLENDDRTARRVSDANFVGMIARLRTAPQLIVLSACQSAAQDTVQSPQQAFTGLGPRLVQIGIPAVVAMHTDVSVLTARQFAASFYRQLLTHGTVDLAMNEARSTLLARGRFDAAVPVLFMRLKDGQLWKPARAVTAARVDEAPSRSTTLSAAERDSLQRQLTELRGNLQLIEERKAEYVLGVDVPMQLIKEERRLREKIAELEAKLRGASQDKT